MDNQIIRMWVPGLPQPGGSKKAFVLKKGSMAGRAVVTDANPKAKGWKSTVSLVASEHISSPFDGPISVEVEFRMPRPKGHFGKRGLLNSAPMHHTVRPDLTKCWRSTEDALKGIAWRDDSQVVDQRICKVYAESPGALITILPVNGDLAPRLPLADPLR